MWKGRKLPASLVMALLESGIRYLFPGQIIRDAEVEDQTPNLFSLDSPRLIAI